MPVEPMTPFDQGCATIHSAISRIVFALGRRAEAVTRAEARAGAAHIDHDERIAAGNEEIAVFRGVRRGLGAGRRAALERESAGSKA